MDKNIWRVPRYLPYLQPALDAATLAVAETKIGHKLPKAYLDLLRVQNGGYIRYTLPDTLHNKISGIGPYFPSITDYAWLAEYEGLSFALEGLFPFDGDGHWNICLDYRNNASEPQVTMIDTECDREEVVAASFGDYLGLLVLDTEGEYVIDTDLPIAEAIRQIANVTAMAFEAPNANLHGYPIYRGQYKGSWVWVSPNKAPAGFIREGEDRYEELKALMGKEALRYPELPESSLLISVSEYRTQDQLFQLLSANGLLISDLEARLKQG